MLLVLRGALAGRRPTLEQRVIPYVRTCHRWPAGLPCLSGLGVLGGIPGLRSVAT
jgi:hypothetical protein